MPKKGEKYPGKSKDSLPENYDNLTLLNEAEPAKALDKILSYNAGAFSSDTVFQEQARKQVVHDIKKVDRPTKGD